MAENHERVSRGLRLVLQGLAPYVARELVTFYGDNWWQAGVMGKLYEDQRRNLPESGSDEELIRSLDVSLALLLFDLHWHEIFRKKLSIDHRNWCKELIGTRNKLAHLGDSDFDERDTWRALDTMSRFLYQIDGERSEQVNAIMREARYGPHNGAALNNANRRRVPDDNSPVLAETPVRDLPGWRNVIEPHPDVAAGRYRNAEFAADLAQVSRGEGTLEYRDPTEFFSRTFITEGMAGLLEQGLRRVLGQDGEPIIQLKTAFGGGKTHSMLALYHLMKSRPTAERIPSLKPIFDRIGISSVPKVHVAVLVGTSMDPARSQRPPHMPGVTINTMWGSMAAQLAASAGDMSLYDYVRDADRKGVAPGSEALKNLFNACGPCLVLIDELVAYAKKIYGVSGLPAGSFDNFTTFVQEISEAARASDNSLVVASIPESEMEIGGEAGRRTLEIISHTFGRMESIWKPVAANEGFEVVRRRLFLDCKDQSARERVCNRFSQFYNSSASDFPTEAKEVSYRERMLSCYPIHPEVFDRLYEDWATLESFQRTRGVLRLMAAVIHELWMNNDESLMIMPGSLPLALPSVRDELTRYLDDGWNALVDREVDGPNSVPLALDKTNSRYGKTLASRRVARTILLGSAPSSREMAVRGIEAARIRLGVVQPGENIAVFNDALSSLQTALSYLYSNSSRDRFWYDTRPTLRKTMSDRATQFSEADLDYEITKRLRKIRREAPFSGVHICPTSSLEVPDEQNVRLVILEPSSGFRREAGDSPGLAQARDILDNRGNTPRKYKNMLVFVAPDQQSMIALKQEVRHYLAWESIENDSDELNLDTVQRREATHSRSRSSETVDIRILETYSWLLVPYIDRAASLSEIIWESISISGGAEPIATKAARKLIQLEAVITRWAPAHLLMELNSLLWRDTDHISISNVWDHLCTYCYSPRLTDRNVLEAAICDGIPSEEYFAYASAYDGSRYLGLKFNQYLSSVETTGLLVKVGIAKEQLRKEEEQRAQEALQREAISTEGDQGPERSGQSTLNTPYPHSGTETPGATIPVAEPTNKHFFLSTKLDKTRVAKDVRDLFEEVITHLSSLSGANVEIFLEVSADLTEGTPPDVVRTVTENCRTLGVDDFGFND
jgi:predicted AAA+ superfamily ATPase